MDNSGEYDLVVRQNPQRARVAGAKEKGKWMPLSSVCFLLNNKIPNTDPFGIQSGSRLTLLLSFNSGFETTMIQRSK